MTTGLKYKIVTEGAGEQVSKAGDKVHVHYTGWLADAEGNKLNEVPFDSSVSRGVPFDFKLGAGYVISGWDLGVAGMKIGEKRLLLLAPEMGYGDRGAGGAIPPKSTLIFEVELLKVG
ncbi:FKBP-type peptidyl-prolyl cis-trans isomerase [bacterium]|nr:FKBP-type peptidyl-prolyl cis-trans isomerase [bacterium]MBT3903206.1 FKBP-type peptidyl-prolyl cis-trans isomerase [bacterium]MBT4577626.1 FKBP-type peptidyl-prolyl cis-trans isomerase [bacterium]MBT5345495.1 FKBP-type peptidyl-prolyl cis-trans isomerase [bacterium]MBT6131189.1 FKBP-type peptidyl-prolyl cis-trans isomerase [bacterium]